MRPDAKPLSDLLRRLEELTRDHVRYGHSEFSVTCKTLSGGDRGVVIHAGKNFRYVIKEQELDH